MEWFFKLILSLFQPKPPVPMPPPLPPIVPPPPVVIPTPSPWNSPKNNYHNTRVLCDNAGLTVEEKNIICACIYQESTFKNGATNHNKNSEGKIMSTDWGLCQINDYYHIGPNKDFRNVEYVIENPDKVVAWMISMYRHGQLRQWVSYSSGAYKQWLAPNSPMWGLGK